MGNKQMADASHWQVTVDFDVYPHDRIGLKCTTGNNSVDPDYVERAKAAHAHGVAVDHYCFGQAESGESQANFFLSTVDYKMGDRFVIDAEVGGVNGQVVLDFINTCHTAKPGIPGLVYGSPYFLRDNNIRPIHGWGLWLADYASRWAFVPPGWQSPNMWQYSQTAKCPGISGECDMSKILSPVATQAKATGLSVLSKSYANHLIKRLSKRAADKNLLNAAGKALLRQLVKVAQTVIGDE